MTHECLVKFAPITSASRLNDPSRKGRTLYEKLQFLPAETSIPLVANHDYGRELGRVEKIFRHEDVDGWWWIAAATLNECPSWLRRGSRASFEYKVLQEDSFRMNIVRHGLVREVSVLTDDLTPKEPAASVVLLKPIDRKPATREQVIYGDGTRIRRYYDNAVIGVR